LHHTEDTLPIQRTAELSAGLHTFHFESQEVFWVRESQYRSCQILELGARMGDLLR
jgi:hypothetical protein